MSANIPSLSSEVQDKLEHLRSLLRAIPSAIVAFSGGVDSTFVLKVARDEIGGSVLALTTTSASLPARELEEARQLAKRFGAQHRVVPTDEVAIESYAKNPINRCYFCKDNLYRICHEHAATEGVSCILDGVNTDDLGDFRPGLDAAREQEVRHPLVEANLSKDEIRQISASMNLPTWDKPAAPCLASRFPYGTPITHERLGRVERAEEALYALGFREVRVRFDGDTARLEISTQEITRCTEQSIREQLVARIKDAGFKRVVLDLAGFRSGGLNDDLATEQT